MNKIILSIIVLLLSAYSYADSVIPINHKKEKSYGIWYYTQIVFTPNRTTLQGYFVAKATSSVWTDYTERLSIDGQEYCILESSLSNIPFESEYLPGDTLYFQDVFSPIENLPNRQNSILYYISSNDTIFCNPLIDFNPEVKNDNIDEYNIEAGIRCVNQDNPISALRYLSAIKNTDTYKNRIDTLYDRAVKILSYKVPIAYKQLTTTTEKLYSYEPKRKIYSQLGKALYYISVDSISYEPERKIYSQLGKALYYISVDSISYADIIVDSIQKEYQNVSIKEKVMSKILWNKALSLWSNNQEEKAIDVLTKLNVSSETPAEILYDVKISLAKWNRKIGRIQEAMNLYQDWFQYMISYNRITEKDFLSDLNSAISLSLDIDDNSTAIKYALYAEILIKQYGEYNSVENAILMNNIANAYNGLEDYQKSIEYHNRSLSIREQIHKMDSILVPKSYIALSYLNISNCYMQQDSIKQAEEYNLKSLDLIGPDFNSHLYPSAITNLAHIYVRQERIDEALSLYGQADSIFLSLNEEEAYSRFYKDRINTLSSIAEIYSQKGDLQQAKNTIREALHIINEKRLHGFILMDILNMGLQFSVDSNDKKSGVFFIENMIEETRMEIAHSFVNLSSNQRKMQLSRCKRYLKNVMWCCFYLNIKNTPQYLYDILLIRKSLLLKVQQDLSSFVHSSHDEVLDSLLNNYVSADSEEKYYIESMLINTAYQKGFRIQSVETKWQNIREALKKDDVAIEFLSYYDNEEKMNCYVALLLCKDSKRPVYIPLAWENWLPEEEDMYNDKTLYELFWRPMKRYLKGKNNVYFAADDKLHTIAIEYALLPNGNRLNEIYNVCRLSSTKEVLENKTIEENNSVLLYGGLNYDMEESILVAQSRISEGHKDFATRAIDLEKFRYGVSYLPGTKIEVNSIGTLLSDYNIPHDVMTENYGTEESFYTIGKTVKYGIIHLATHGFFWSKEDVQTRNYVNFLHSFEESEDEDEESLLRSGLFLSGANLGLKGVQLPDDVEDGVLTAKELSDMNLGSVSLVVLSACQSGLGEISGEGVFGLQRGFKLAGAKSLLMSLWKVDDKATQLLMTEFYHQYLKGKSKTASLRAAQNFVRSYPEYHDPEYWAGFILLDALN